MDPRDVSATGVIRLGNLKLSEPANYGAGFEGVLTALKHLQKERGIIHAIPALTRINQIDGFDCPGCAWPDPDHRSRLGEFCENGAKALAEESTTVRADADFFKRHTVQEISEWSDYEIGKSGRLTEPMMLLPGSKHYQSIGWQDAFLTIGKQLQSLTNPNQAIFYTSGRSSNEAAFLYGLFARAFGTNNLPDCSNMCHESSGVGLKQTLGIGKGSVTLEDFDQAELILILGQNPGTNHPRMLSSLQKCKRNGGSIVSINPLAEAGLMRFKNPQEFNGWIGKGTQLADIHLPVKINQDVPLLKWLMKRVIELDSTHGDVLDHTFIKQKTTGFEAFKKDLQRYPYQDLAEDSGVSIDLLEKTAQLIASKSRIIICWAMGLTQHKNAVDNIRECVNLLLLKGSIGKPGAGTCPVRGHSNVQGDRTVGIMHYVSPSFNEALQKTFGFNPPTATGLDTVHSILAMHEHKAKVFISLGGNFVSAASDTYYTAQALRNCELTVSISTKLNRTHVIPGKASIILPTLGRSEADINNGSHRFVTVENSMGKVHRSKGRLQPASKQLKSEPEIIAGIAEATFGNGHQIPWNQLGSDYQLLREKIGTVVEGFESYQERSGDTGFYLPNNAREGDFSKVKGGRALFSINQLPKHHLKSDEYLLMTIRSHDQFNTTIYGLDDRYRGIYNERRILLINPNDLIRENLSAGELVDIESHYDDTLRIAKKFILVAYQIPERNLAAYFPETNVLVPINHFADGSHTPISKSIKVSLKKT